MGFKVLILTAMLIQLLFECCSFSLPATRITTNPSTKNICLEGVCVPFHLCVNGNVLTTGANLFAPRVALENGKDGPQICNKTELCCSLNYDDDDYDEDNEINSNELTEDTIPSADKLPTANLSYEREQQIDEFGNYFEIWRPKCGVRNFNVVRPRISGDGTAEIAEFPWMTLVLKKLPEKKHFDYTCGGSLIHPSVVLTAAHCVVQIETSMLHVRAGEWNIENNFESLPHQDRAVQSVSIHPHFVKSTLVNDIALLLLKTPVTLAENVQPICLPPPNLSFVNQRCIVTGWGKDDYGRGGRFQTVLKKVELPIIANDACERLLRRTVLGKYFELDKSFLCAGTEYGKDSCKGDGGSPLVCKISEKTDSYYQSGIVSWGIGCKESNIPGAYVNVARFRKWIDEEMRKMNMTIDSYIYA